MNRTVLWSKRALDDLKKQTNFIARDNSQAARNITAKIRMAGNSLGRAPIGRPSRIPDAYEKSVTGLRYVILYELRDNPDILVITRVVHTSRDWPKGQWPE